VWLPEGLHQSKGDSTAARQSAAKILDRIQTDLLPQSWLDSDPEGVILRHTCASTMRYRTWGTTLLCRCCRTGVMASRSS
jgi:hypothetical protein